MLTHNSCRLNFESSTDLFSTWITSVWDLGVQHCAKRNISPYSTMTKREGGGNDANDGPVGATQDEGRGFVGNFLRRCEGACASATTCLIPGAVSATYLCLSPRLTQFPHHPFFLPPYLLKNSNAVTSNRASSTSGVLTILPHDSTQKQRVMKKQLCRITRLSRIMPQFCRIRRLTRIMPPLIPDITPIAALI